MQLFRPDDERPARDEATTIEEDHETHPVDRGPAAVLSPHGRARRRRRPASDRTAFRHVSEAEAPAPC